MKDKPIDFSSLDPSRDVLRWEARIEFIASRAAAHQRRRLTVTGQGILWARPLLAIAASVALVGWISLLASETEKATTSADPMAAMITWAARDEVPTTEIVIAAFGGSIVEE